MSDEQLAAKEGEALDEELCREDVADRILTVAENPALASIDVSMASALTAGLVDQVSRTSS